MKDPRGPRVECPEHGDQGPAFVCRHLNLREPVGFVEGYDPDDPDEGLFQAWCSACDEILVQEGEWNDRSEAFAGPRLVCRACYREMKALNRRGR
jgi:hypothetical protein